MGHVLVPLTEDVAEEMPKAGSWDCRMWKPAQYTHLSQARNIITVVTPELERA